MATTAPNTPTQDDILMSIDLSTLVGDQAVQITTDEGGIYQISRGNASHPVGDHMINIRIGGNRSTFELLTKYPVHNWIDRVIEVGKPIHGSQGTQSSPVTAIRLFPH